MLLRFGDDILMILQTGKKEIYSSPVVGRQLGTWRQKVGRVIAFPGINLYL